MVGWLDCYDLETALASLGELLSVEVNELRAALFAYDHSRFSNYSEDPYRRMPRELLETLGRDVNALTVDGAFYFHGTRSLDPDDFYRHGVLPLDQMVERIWSTLYELVRDGCTEDEWADFRRAVESDAGGHDGFLYRLKAGDRVHFGPYALLVREIFFDPSATGSHDYLGCPEIVQDIARCYRSACGFDLETRFCESSQAVIVRFRSTDVWEGALPTALWYVFAKLRDDELTSNANGGFDGHGRAVPPEDVVAVEVVEGAG